MRKFFWFLVLVVIGLGIYYQGLGVRYYGDDLTFVFDNPAAKVGFFFTHPNPFGHYRPLEAGFLAGVQTHFGVNTVPVHLTQLLMHVLLSAMVLAFMVQSGFSKLQAGVATVFMLVSQANVLVVVSNDTFSQLAGTFFGCVSLWLLHWAVCNPAASEATGGASANYRWLVASVIAFACALLSKETSVSFLILIGILVFIRFRTDTQLGKALVQFTPFVAVLIFYLVVRSLVIESPPQLGEGRNDFRLGWNIITNLGMCLGVMSLPFSSVDVLTAFKGQNYGMVVIYAAGTAVFIGLVLYGLARCGRRRLVALIAAFMIAALIPMVALNHVSEAYAYNSLPLFSILVGAGLGQLGRRMSGNSWRRLAYVSIIAACFMVQYMSTQTKINLMHTNGDRAFRLLQQIEPFIVHVPNGGELVLVNPPASAPEYSVFTYNGFDVLALGLRRSIERLSGSRDIVTRIADSSEKIERKSGRVILTLSNGTVLYY